MNAELTRDQIASLADAARETKPAPRRFDTIELFRGAAEIEIAHQGAIYRLKITRQGKLILNK